MKINDNESLLDRNALAAHRSRRLFLLTLRLMAAGGINDAHAVNALIGAFGKSYRRPLVLMRAMILELSRASQNRIMVAPCCCTRMTVQEAQIIAAAASAVADPHGTHDRLCALLGTQNALGALSCMQAVGQCFEDLGQPLS